MITTIIRCVIIYFIALFVLRLMGKRQIGQMQPFELVITLIIADLATVPMADSKIPILNGVVPLLTLVLIHFLITLLSLLCNKFNKFINGNPIIVIDENGVNEENLKKMYMNVEDLIESCRNAGYFNLNDIHYAIVETNGMVSILPKSGSTPVNRDDMKILKQDERLGAIIISDGKFSSDGLNKLALTKEGVLKFINEQGTKSEKDIAALVSYGNEIYYKEMGKKVKYLKNTSLSSQTISN